MQVATRADSLEKQYLAQFKRMVGLDQTKLGAVNQKLVRRCIFARYLDLHDLGLGNIVEDLIQEERSADQRGPLEHAL